MNFATYNKSATNFVKRFGECCNLQEIHNKFQTKHFDEYFYNTCWKNVLHQNHVNIL